MAEVGKEGPEVAETSKPDVEALPKLSPAEHRAYNRLADHMDLFHNHFRNTWNTLYEACSANRRPAGMSIRQFLMTGIEFCHHLETHHSIEEYHVFPALATKMPAFRKELELLTQHKQIHAGLDKFEDYLTDCRSGKRELRMDEMKGIMDTFGTVLWQHLDDEVNQLKAENMRNYWSLDEMRRLMI